MKNWHHLKRPWCWERLKARGEGDNRGWDAWIASPIQWTWIWVNSSSWWGRPGVLQSIGSQSVRHDWVTELKWKLSPIWSPVFQNTFNWKSRGNGWPCFSAHTVIYAIKCAGNAVLSLKLYCKLLTLILPVFMHTDKQGQIRRDYHKIQPVSRDVKAWGKKCKC